jgi:hypothetical protein
MKKALIVLLLLAVAAGGLFAQTVAWSGHVRSGLEVAIPDEGDVTLLLYHQDPASTYRFQVGVSYTNADGNAGAAGTLRLVNGTFGHDGAYVWAKPSDVISLRAGTSGQGGFGSLGGFDASSGAADTTGFSLVFGPFTGLSVAASIAPSDTKLDLTRYNFGVKYAAAGLLTAVANLGYDGDGNGDEAAIEVAAGLDFLGLADNGLTKLAVDVRAVNVTKDLTWLGIGPRIGFRVNNITSAGNLTGALRTQIYLPMGDSNEDLDFAALFEVSLPLVTGINARLGVAYSHKDTLKAPAANGTIDWRDWDVIGKAIGGGTDPVLVVRPSVTFNNIGGAGGGSIETGLSFQTQLGDNGKTQNAIFAAFNVGF